MKREALYFAVCQDGYRFAVMRVTSVNRTVSGSIDGVTTHASRDRVHGMFTNEVDARRALPHIVKSVKLRDDTMARAQARLAADIAVIQRTIPLENV